MEDVVVGVGEFGVGEGEAAPPFVEPFEEDASVVHPPPSGERPIETSMPGSLRYV